MLASWLHETRMSVDQLLIGLRDVPLPKLLALALVIASTQSPYLAAPVTTAAAVAAATEPADAGQKAATSFSSN
jgi:hypothetical protein